MQFWKFSTSAIAALLASVALVSAAGGDEPAIASPDSAVLQLTAENFKQSLEENPLMLVEFFAPWCGHCKTLGPEFSKAADELKVSHPDLALAQVNCVDHEDVCRSHEIRGYPTLKLTRGLSQPPQDYEGPRDAAGIVDYMVKMSQPAVTTVTDVPAFIKKTKEEIKPYVVQILPKAAHAKSADFNQTFTSIANAGRSERTHYSLEDDKSIAKFGKLINADISGDKPQYLLIHPGQLDDVRVFDGETFTIEDFSEWAANAQVPDFGDINRETYLVYMGSTLPLGYYFYNTAEERADVADFFASKGKELRGKMNFVALDATQFGRHAEILSMDPEIVPLFAIQDNTTGRKYGIDQSEHPSPSTETIEEFVEKFLAGEAEAIVKSEPLPTPEDEDYDENVTKLVAHNYNDVLADDSKTSLSSTLLHGVATSVVVAKLDHTLNDVDMLDNIEGYPTIIFYPANGTRDPKTGLRVGIVYEDARDFGSFKEFIDEKKVSDAAQDSEEGGGRGG
ncbi:hypothetical protein JCM33374_g3227 [Metschnikowia sp. JCM 33374]|nr:hypothetical protein JCM33374_g3227 [Metschnikowia sp. JCM 33374]